MEGKDVSTQWIEALEEIKKNTLSLLLKLEFKREETDGVIRTTVKPTLQQQLHIRDNINQYRLLRKKVLHFLEKYPFQHAQYIEIESDYESYLYFYRIGKDMDEERWKNFFIDEFSNITDNLIAYIREIFEIIFTNSQFKCFRTAEKCNLTINMQEKSIFVIMPFDAMFNDIYQIGIKETMISLGYKCSRADEIFHTHDIMCRGICKPIQESSYIVADMTNKNANVFFELGLAYGFEKNVLLIANSIDDIPFDLRGMRSIIYNGQIVTLRENLIKMFK